MPLKVELQNLPTAVEFFQGKAGSIIIRLHAQRHFVRTEPELSLVRPPRSNWAVAIMNKKLDCGPSYWHFLHYDYYEPKN